MNTDVIIINVIPRQWSAERVLREEDVEKLLGGAQIPPEVIKDLGRKRVFPSDNETLVQFDRLARRARRAIELRSLKAFGRVFVTHPGAAKNALDELKTIQSEWESLKNQFVGEYDQVLTDWFDDLIRAGLDPAWVEVIRKSTLSAPEAAKRFDFSFYVFEAGPASGMEDGFSQELASFPALVAEEVAGMAREALRNLKRGTRTKTASCLGWLNDMAEKIRHVTPLVPAIASVGAIVEAEMVKIPSGETWMEQQHVDDVRVLLEAIGTPEKIRRVMDSGQLQVEVPSPAPAPVPEESDDEVLDENPVVEEDTTTKEKSSGIPSEEESPEPSHWDLVI
jgi:hypothetical protein